MSRLSTTAVHCLWLLVAAQVASLGFNLKINVARLRMSFTDTEINNNPSFGEEVNDYVAAIPAQIANSMSGLTKSEAPVMRPARESGFIHINGKRIRDGDLPTAQNWYKVKQSQISKNQKRALQRLWPMWGVDLQYGQQISPETLFNRPTPSSGTTCDAHREYQTIIDVGFGMGDSISHLAHQCPKNAHIGIEIHRAGVASALQKVEMMNLTNVRVIRATALMALNHLVDKCADGCCFYFPDPWPNAHRDGDRRVIQPKLMLLLTQKLKPGAYLRIATDVDFYVRHVFSVMDIVNQELQLKCQEVNSTQTSQSRMQWQQTFYSNHTAAKNVPEWRPVTKYELKAVVANRTVVDVEYRLHVIAD